MPVLREKRRVRILFITHDLSLAWLIADRIAVMYLGRSCSTAVTGVTGRPLLGALMRAVTLAAVLLVAIWFLDVITPVILLLAAAVFMAIPLNVPVTALERRGLPRIGGTAVVFLVMLVVVGGLGWFLIPRIAEDLHDLVARLPAFLTTLGQRLDSLFGPGASETLDLQVRILNEVVPALSGFVTRLGRLTLDLLAGLALLLVLLTLVGYILARPRDLLRAYLSIFPSHLRHDAERAFVTGSRGTVAWIRANLVVGTIEAVATAVFLTIAGVPGAFFWGVFAFFAELVPNIGIYLMAIPPIIVASAVDPLLGVAVGVFYVVLSFIMGHFVAPAVRAREMDLHPVYLLFAFFAMAAAFGFLGALISTPLAAFVAAYWNEFFAKRREAVDEPAIERMLGRDDAAGPSSEPS